MKSIIKKINKAKATITKASPNPVAILLLLIPCEMFMPLAIILSKDVGGKRKGTICQKSIEMVRQLDGVYRLDHAPLFWSYAH